jgi:hypothetical protein
MSDALARLVTMHAYCRPADSRSERLFIHRYIASLGAVEDDYGNWSLVLGDNPRHIWSCHTDTVHRLGGSQRVKLSADGILSATGGSCLGADDTAGVWLLCELVRRGVPGRYVWHYGEEMGCLGSRSLVDSLPDWIAETDMVIAVDRKGTSDVITHQMGYRTASSDFATALALQLNAQGLQYAPSSHGLYTDSEAYADWVSECTNLSIGYQGNHTEAETLDTRHTMRLLDALASLDIASLPVVRIADPVSSVSILSPMRDDLTSPVVVTGDFSRAAGVGWNNRDFHWYRECGATVSDYQQVCFDCGADNPADDLTTRTRREDYLDGVYAEVQMELEKQVQRAKRR